MPEFTKLQNVIKSGEYNVSGIIVMSKARKQVRNRATYMISFKIIDQTTNRLTSVNLFSGSNLPVKGFEAPSIFVCLCIKADVINNCNIVLVVPEKSSCRWRVYSCTAKTNIEAFYSSDNLPFPSDYYRIKFLKVFAKKNNFVVSHTCKEIKDLGYGTQNIECQVIEKRNLDNGTILLFVWDGTNNKKKFRYQIERMTDLVINKTKGSFMPIVIEKKTGEQTFKRVLALSEGSWIKFTDLSVTINRGWISVAFSFKTNFQILGDTFYKKKLFYYVVYIIYTSSYQNFIVNDIDFRFQVTEYKYSNI
ncbi:hypothetical protein MHBO_000537 [Bonamia ostreae]|uniref:Uncharacterized protein n=1 Tax=Bonamia ostreae TaxID=126728 RepID=A0ABV2AFW9_9EUKA